MLCPDCFGGGRIIVSYHPDKQGVFQAICPTCHNVGFIHCCEGEVASPPSAPQHQSATSDPRSRLPGRTS